MKKVCNSFSLERYIHLNSPVVAAKWHEDQGQWKIQVAGAKAGEYSAEILVNAGGILSHYKMPEIEGISDFSKTIMHSAAWDDQVDLTDKRVAIIGAGASAVQILPAIQTICRSIHIYIRTPSWISPPVGLPTERAVSNPLYSDEEKRRFREDAEYSLSARKAMEAAFNGMFAAFIKDDPAQMEMRKGYEKYMRGLLQDPELQSKLIPPFEAGCRRINPSAPYLLALQKANVHPVVDPIRRITSEGILTSSQQANGEVIEKVDEVDVLVAATGFDTSFRPRFPIIGRDGVDLKDLWAENPISYMGTGVAGFPNYLIFLGPNTPISNGGLIGKCTLRQLQMFKTRRA